MNVIDKNFFILADEIKRLSEKELYHRIRESFEKVPETTRKSCMDFFNNFNYWGRLDPDKGIYEEIELKEKALYFHMDDFVWLYERLGDYRSKKTLYAILSNWYRYDFESTTQAREYLFDDYFDLDIVKCGRNEVIADLGAFTGDTVISYIKNYGEDCYRKIYCYEVTPDVFQILRQNLSGYRDIEFRMKGVGESEGIMSLVTNSTSSSANTVRDGEGTDVEVTTLDTDITEPLTLIKADIEGSEQKAIKGAREHIKNDHPKLLISVYHNNEDIWKIPRMISDISDDYDFYLRYNSSPVYPTEITLTAV